MTKLLAIETELKTYYVDSEGRIGSKDMLPSDTWRLVGAQEYNNFGYRTVRYSLEDVRAGVVPWTHKNGSQKCRLIDLDHGTYREWREKVLGVRETDAQYCRRCRTISHDKSWCYKCRDSRRDF